jgi:DNA-binding NarL/FixJ family response regulator
VQKLRVVVADNHSLTLSGVADSLQAHGLEVVGQGSSAADAIELVREFSPDALVTDLDFGPGPTGLDVAQRLRQSHPQLGIVVLSAYGDPRLHQVTLDEIPQGLVYLIKQQVETTNDIVKAVHSSIDKAHKAESGELPRVDLTSSQISVLRHIAQGLSNTGIAQALSISEESVAKTINRMAKRLGISNSPDVNIRAALVQQYFDLVGSNR